MDGSNVVLINITTKKLFHIHVILKTYIFQRALRQGYTMYKQSRAKPYKLHFRGSNNFLVYKLFMSNLHTFLIDMLLPQ